MSLSAAVGSWDIYVSSLFYDGGHFLLEDNFLGNLIRRGIPELIVLSAAVIFAVWLYGKISCRVCGGIDNRVVLLTSGTMLVGPFLIVNGIFKTFWGRARPRDIDLFGAARRLVCRWKYQISARGTVPLCPAIRRWLSGCWHRRCWLQKSFALSRLRLRCFLA